MEYGLNKVEIWKMEKIEANLVRKSGLKYVPCFFFFFPKME